MWKHEVNKVEWRVSVPQKLPGGGDVVDMSECVEGIGARWEVIECHGHVRLCEDSV